MANEEARELMESAWANRRASFDAAPEKKRALLKQAQESLRTAAAMCRAQDAPVSNAHAVQLLANIEVDLGHEERARALWEEAVRILRTTDDALQLDHKVRHLKDLHRHGGRLADAEAESRIERLTD